MGLSMGMQGCTRVTPTSAMIPVEILPCRPYVQATGADADPARPV